MAIYGITVGNISREFSTTPLKNKQFDAKFDEHLLHSTLSTNNYVLNDILSSSLSQCNVFIVVVTGVPKILNTQIRVRTQ